MSFAQVAKKLGGAKVLGPGSRSEGEFIGAVRAGLPVRALDTLLEDLGHEFLQGEVFQLVGSARTLQRRRAASKARLSPAESDRLARVARVVVRAEEAFGDPEKGRRWLSRPNRALGGERPLMMLDSDLGALAVERVLGRIEHGVYS